MYEKVKLQKYRTLEELFAIEITLEYKKQEELTYIAQSITNNLL